MFLLPLIQWETFLRACELETISVHTESTVQLSSRKIPAIMPCHYACRTIKHEIPISSHRLKGVRIYGLPSNKFILKPLFNLLKHMKSFSLKLTLRK